MHDMTGMNVNFTLCKTKPKNKTKNQLYNKRENTERNFEKVRHDNPQNQGNIKYE